VVTSEDLTQLVNCDSSSKSHPPGKRVGSLIEKRLKNAKTIPLIGKLHIPCTTQSLSDKRLNRAVVRPVDGYRASPDVPKAKDGDGLIRYVEKSTEDAEQDVEYDLDEEVGTVSNVARKLES